MFFEDFSSPKYLSNTEDWVFPISADFYDATINSEVALSQSHVRNNDARYRSRILPISKQSSSLKLCLSYTENNSPEIAKIHFYGDKFKYLGYVVVSNSILSGSDFVEYSSQKDIVATMEETIKWYSVEVYSDINYLKIYASE